MSLAGHTDLERELALAQRLADAARPIALRYFRRTLTVEQKADHSPVTVADRTIETELRRLIRAEFPAHGIHGEEFDDQAGSEFTWVLDPIDGTKSYISGLPLFGTLIALLQEQQPVLGVMDMPALGERWVGRIGAPTLFNEHAARTSGCSRIERARVYTTTPDEFDAADWRRFDTLSRRAALRRFGGDCYSYGLLASGHCDLVVEARLKPHDFLVLPPIIAGAGGRITDWNGAPLGLESDGHVVAAASEPLLAEALEILTKQ